MEALGTQNEREWHCRYDHRKRPNSFPTSRVDKNQEFLQAIISQNTGIIFKLPHLISWPAPARNWVLDMKSSRDQVSDYQLTPVFHYHFSTAMLITAHMTPWLQDMYSSFRDYPCR